MSPLTLFAGAMLMNILGAFLGTEAGRLMHAGAIVLCIMGFAELVNDRDGGKL